MKIVLAVDGSDQAYFAARALEHLAPPDRVVVLHAVDVPRPAYPGVMPELALEITAATERRLREEGERVLNFTAAILPPHMGRVSKRLDLGKPAEMILSVAEEVTADLIVLGARGLGPVRELLLGSVSHRVLSHAPCPTLIVNRALGSLRHILLPLQGPEDAEAAVRFLASKPFKEPPEVKVLSAEPYAHPAWPAGFSASASPAEELVTITQRFVDDVAARLTALGYRATGVVRTEAPAHAILQEAAKTDPDLIMMGTRGLRGTSRFLLGSVSHAVLHRAPCPMLVFR
jgi:nucleotide-binding universal stress UspA family protein